jgi:hypothetical protein
MFNNFRLYGLKEILGIFIIRNLKFKKRKEMNLLNCIYAKGDSDQVRIKFLLLSKKKYQSKFFLIKKKKKNKKNKNLIRKLYL